MALDFIENTFTNIVRKRQSKEKQMTQKKLTILKPRMPKIQYWGGEDGKIFEFKAGLGCIERNSQKQK